MSCPCSQCQQTIEAAIKIHPVAPQKVAHHCSEPTYVFGALAVTKDQQGRERHVYADGLGRPMFDSAQTEAGVWDVIRVNY